MKIRIKNRLGWVNVGRDQQGNDINLQGLKIIKKNTALKSFKNKGGGEGWDKQSTVLLKIQLFNSSTKCF